MPQARLPDINTAYIMYRRMFMSALPKREYTTVQGCLYAINALLPKEYRVMVSNLQYEDKVKADVIAICTKCKEQHNYNEINVFNKTLEFIESVLCKTMSQKVWVCTKCKRENVLSETQLLQSVLTEPSYLTIVPKPPKRQDGIIDKNTFHRKFEAWAWTMIHELEERMAQFRDDNWHKQGEMYDMEDDLDTEGDEE